MYRILLAFTKEILVICLPVFRLCIWCVCGTVWHKCRRKRLLHTLVRYDCGKPGPCIGEEALSQIESSLVFIVLGLVDNYCLLKNGEVDCSRLQTGNLRVLSAGLCTFLMAFGQVTEDETMNSHWNSREEVSCSALFLFPCYLSFSILFKTCCWRQRKELNSSLRTSGLRFW